MAFLQSCNPTSIPSKRKREEQESQSDMENIKRRNRKEEEEEEAPGVDRLTDLPQSLQLHILSFLKTHEAIQTSMISKSSVNLWTLIPALMVSSYQLRKPLKVYDKFVNTVLSLRDRDRDDDQSVKLDRLVFHREGVCSAKILNKVFNFVFSHGVKEFEASIGHSRNNFPWPVRLDDTPSHSLISLKLESASIMDCPFLGPRSASLKNLKVLHLKKAMIANLDPFSGFPALEKLTLINCHLHTNGDTLNIHALQLLELRISFYERVTIFNLMTPKLRFLEYGGLNFPGMKTHEGGLPVLDTLVIDLQGFNRDKRMFDDLMLWFDTLHNVKSLTVFLPVVHLLSSFPDELANRSSPFRELKCLKMDFRGYHSQKLLLLAELKAYLLQKSRDAKFTLIHPRCGTFEIQGRC